tara:strand:+ start:139 stop:543 length:405 start_codon:yes stop_codon:yes gene_type:complete
MVDKINNKISDEEFVKVSIKIGKAVLIIGIILSFLVIAMQITESPVIQEKKIPTVEWEIQRINSTHISIAHISGESIESKRTIVTVEGRSRPIGRVGYIGKGDVIITQAYEGTLVELFWEEENEYLRLLHRDRA